MRGLIAIALVAWASAARAQDGATIAWDAPAGCPDAESLRRAVEAQLGVPLTDPSVPAVRIDVRARGDDRRGWRVTIVMEGGERTIEGATCVEVTAAAALVIALALVPDEPPAAVRPKRRRRTNPEPARDSELPGTVVAAAPRAAPPIRWWSMAGLAGNPDASAGVVAAVAGERGRWRVGVAGAYWFERRYELDGDPPRGGDLSRWMVSGRVCWRWRTWWCGGGEFGEIRGRGFGFMGAESGAARWVGPLAGVEDGWPLTPRIHLWGQLDVSVPLRRPSFTIGELDELDEVYRMPPVDVRAYAGVAVRFN